VKPKSKAILFSDLSYVVDFTYSIVATIYE